MLDSSLEIEFQWRVLIYKASNTILWQVLKMESQVLNFLYFQLSVPTTKTFLRCNIEHLLPICYRYDVINNKFTHPAYSIFYFSGDSFKQHKLLARYFKMLAIVHCIFSWNLTKLIYSETCNYSDIGSLCRTGVLGKLFGRVDSCWVQLPKVLTFPHSCIRCFSCPMDTQSVRSSMGLPFSASLSLIWVFILFYFPFIKGMAEEDASVYFFQNSTLEHYTRYTASELKTTVLALEDLQLNTNGCCLNAIRDKYRQQKVKHILSGGVWADSMSMLSNAHKNECVASPFNSQVVFRHVLKLFESNQQRVLLFSKYTRQFLWFFVCVW